MLIMLQVPIIIQRPQLFRPQKKFLQESKILVGAIICAKPQLFERSQTFLVALKTFKNLIFFCRLKNFWWGWTFFCEYNFLSVLKSFMSPAKFLKHRKLFLPSKLYSMSKVFGLLWLFWVSQKICESQKLFKAKYFKV